MATSSMHVVSAEVFLPEYTVPAYDRVVNAKDIFRLGFELPEDVAGWTYVQNATAGSFTRYSGSESAGMPRSGSAQGGYRTTNAGGLTANVRRTWTGLLPGKTYTFTVYARKFKDLRTNANIAVTVGPYTVLKKTGVSGSSWTKLEHTFNATSSSIAITLGVSSGVASGVVMYWDDISLVQHAYTETVPETVVQPSGTPLVINPESAEVALDESWNPFVQARLTASDVDLAALEAIDPRRPTRMRLTVSERFSEPGTMGDIDEYLRERFGANPTMANWDTAFAGYTAGDFDRRFSSTYDDSRTYGAHDFSTTSALTGFTTTNGNTTLALTPPYTGPDGRLGVLLSLGAVTSGTTVITSPQVRGMNARQAITASVMMKSADPSSRARARLVMTAGFEWASEWVELQDDDWTEFSVTGQAYFADLGGPTARIEFERVDPGMTRPAILVDDLWFGRGRPDPRWNDSQERSEVTFSMDLGIRSRELIYATGTATFELASDEALLMDQKRVSSTGISPLALNTTAAVNLALGTIGASVGESVTVPEQVVYSEGFESGTAGGWTAGPNMTIAPTMMSSRSGAWSLAVMWDTSGTVATNTYKVLMQRTFTGLEVGRQYTMKVWHRSTMPDRQLRLRTSSSSGGVVNTWTNTGGAWVERQTPTFTFSATSASMVVELVQGSAVVSDSFVALQNFWVDDFTLTRLSYNYVPGGSTITPESAVWGPGVSAWDYVSPLVQAAGMRLWCDEMRQWRLEPAGLPTGVTTTLSDSENAIEIDFTTDRDDELWFDAATVKYEWTDSGGLRQVAYDTYATTGWTKSETFSYARPYPGPGAAQALVERALRLGRDFEATAVNDYTAYPGNALVIQRTGSPNQGGFVRAVNWSFPSNEMRVQTRGMVAL